MVFGGCGCVRDGTQESSQDVDVVVVRKSSRAEPGDRRARRVIILRPARERVVLHSSLDRRVSSQLILIRTTPPT